VARDVKGARFEGRLRGQIFTTAALQAWARWQLADFGRVRPALGPHSEVAAPGPNHREKKPKHGPLMWRPLDSAASFPL